MKKLILMFAAIAAVSFASCGTNKLKLKKQQLIQSVSLIQSQQ